MGQKEKLLERFRTCPKDFTIDELVRLLGYLGFVLDNKGRTSGSRVMFKSNLHSLRIMIHRPHPGNELRDYQIKQILGLLEQEGLI